MSSIKKNFIYNVFYQLLVLALPLITAPYVSRVLGAEGIGTYSYSYSIANYFLLFAMLGVANHGNRSIAKNRDNRKNLSKTFWNIYAIQIFNSIIVVAIYVIYIIQYSNNKIIATIQLIYLISSAFDINWFYFGMEKFKLTVTRNTVCKILTVIAVFVFVRERGDLWKYVLIMSLGTLISQSIVWVFIRRYINFTFPSIREMLKNVVPIIILFLPVLAYSVYRLMDKIMLGNMSTMRQVGLFDNADKIIVMPMGIITALGTVMLPRSSNLVANGQLDKQKQYIYKSMQYVSIMACAIAFGLAGIANILAPVYFGTEFVQSGQLIALMAPTILFTSWANVIRTQYLIPNKHDKIYVTSMLVAALFNIILNLIFIPKYQANGVLIGTIVAEFTVMFIQCYSVRKELPIKKYFITNFIYIIFGVIMFIAVRMIGNTFGTKITTLFLQIIVGGILYLVLTIGYLYIRKDDMLFVIFSKLTRFAKPHRDVNKM
ncbi:flippase [Clostridium arbusti]|uniref:flippase n=1 Tax=Clostridium arbusti TaxID=1137848 RepID=UPI000288924A|nr:flippase [Clostridium arbusti]